MSAWLPNPLAFLKLNTYVILCQGRIKMHCKISAKVNRLHLQQFKDPTEVPKLWSSGFSLSIVRFCNMVLPLLASAQQRLAHEFPGSWKQTENSDGFAGGSYHQIQHDQ